MTTSSERELRSYRVSILSLLVSGGLILGVGETLAVIEQSWFLAIITVMVSIFPFGVFWVQRDEILG